MLREGVKLDAEPEPATPEHDEPETEPEARVRGPEGAALGSLELFFASVCQSARRLPAHVQANLKRQVHTCIYIPTRRSHWPGLNSSSRSYASTYRPVHDLRFRLL